MSKRRTVTFSKTHSVGFDDVPVPDIDVDIPFLELFESVRSYSMTSKEAMYALYSAVHYLLDRKIPGDFVECGVWRGGSSLLASLLLKQRKESARSVYLYDTFEGMPPPTEVDIDFRGRSAAEIMQENRDEVGWCYAPLEGVRRVFESHRFDFETHFVQGDVVQTLTETCPREIALLRLDTDWYASTLAELEHLYPRLSVGGVLIIDDYGHWEGARKAASEYFSRVPPPLLVRVNYSVRLAIKI